MKTIHHYGQERRGSATQKAERIARAELDKAGWTEEDLERRRKGDPWKVRVAARSEGDVRKVRLAQRLRRETSVTWKWISEQLHMGTWTHAASLKIKIEPDEQNVFKLE